MKCVLQKTTTEYTEFRFVQTGSSDAVIRYSSSAHSVRLSNNDAHGFFYIEQQPGILKSRIIFKNAYGSEVGKMVVDHWSQQFLIKLDNSDYHCTFNKNGAVEMTICQQQHKKIINSCKIELGRTPSLFMEKNVSQQDACLILAGCWYLNIAMQENRHLQYN